jgi:two-component system sensor histidine kinase PhoQ
MLTFGMTLSVRQRLLLSVLLPLFLLLGGTAFLLDLRFRTLSEASLRDQLDSQLVALIAASDPDEAGRVNPVIEDAESRLALPESGLYARVVNRLDRVVWLSPSAEGIDIAFGLPLIPGERTFRYLDVPGRGSHAAVSRGLRWEDARRRRIDLTFTVIASLDPLQVQLHNFRRELLGVFVLLGALLLLVGALALRWALRPLRNLARQITAVETGQEDRLDGTWPAELRGVVTNLNALLQGERARITRYRDTLGNLAHSLKTPLAVVRASIDRRADAQAATINAQIDTMAALVDHHLKRAASGGVTVGQRAVALLPVAQDLRTALLKVHATKDLSIELTIDGSLQFLGERDDLYELLGNLMDNASKWCGGRVQVRAAQGDFGRLLVQVDDDGPGIPEQDRQRVLQRGVRADERIPGHGLGLAMVQALVHDYGGSLVCAVSDLGGASLQLQLPSG